MSSFSKSKEFQATTAVNSLLKNLLPGAQKIGENGKNKRRLKPKGSTAQLIDRHLKKRVEINERNVHDLKKKEKKVRKQQAKSKKTHNDRLEQEARIQVLIKHQSNDELTEKEKAYLEKTMMKNIRKAKAWDFDEDEEDQLKEIQNYILEKSLSSSNSTRSLKRRKKVKEFKEDMKGINHSLERRYPGLTPGLAPVGLSDEESSDEE